MSQGSAGRNTASIPRCDRGTIQQPRLLREAFALSQVAVRLFADSGTGHDSPLWKAVQKELWLCRHSSYFRVLNQYWHRKGKSPHGSARSEKQASRSTGNGVANPSFDHHHFFNAEKFLAEAIDSVFAQTFQDWELLLVDDGSTDRSTVIAETYARRYPGRVRYFDHDGHRNLGKSSSRNLGLGQAKGQYVAFLDADDVFLPHKLARQVGILEAHPMAAMVYGRTQYWYGWTGKPSDLNRDAISELGIQAGKLYRPPLLMTRFLKNGGIVPCLCALLVRRLAIEKVGAFEESIQQLYEDRFSSRSFARACRYS